MTVRSAKLALMALVGVMNAALANGDGPAPLPAEKVGEPLRTMRRSGDFLAPKPDGKGWYFITSYNPVARNSLPCQTFIVDLDTAQVTMKMLEPAGALHNMVVGNDGRAYIGHYAAAGVHVFDPRDISMRWIPFPEVADHDLPYQMKKAADGRIYMGTASSHARVIEFDPATEKFRNFGIQGVPHGAPRYIYSMAVDDTHVYSAAGKTPWYLVAADRKSMEQKVLLKDMEYLDVTGSGDRCYARVTETLGGKNPPTIYRLKNGQAEKVDKMESGQPAAKTVAPEMLLTLARPSSDGKAQIWWRYPQAPWRHADLDGIQMTVWGIERIQAMPDGRLFGVPKAYEDCFIYDPVANRFTVLGKSPLSASAIECLGGKVFIAGYPGTYLVEYDPARPWTYFTSTPETKEPALPAPESNPRECVRFQLQTHHVRGSAIGADGFIYLGAHAERQNVGGALGWWDPVHRKAGGLREPFLVQDCCDITAARGGKLIVYSSHPVADPMGKTPKPPEGKLFVLDVATKSLVREIVPMPGMTWCGPVAAAGDKLFGIGRVEKAHHLYVVDLASGKTVMTQPVADRPVEHFATDAAGRLYVFIGNTLVRIVTETNRLEALGTVEQPGAMAILGADLYWEAAGALLRAKGIARKDGPRPEAAPSR